MGPGTDACGAMMRRVIIVENLIDGSACCALCCFAAADIMRRREMRSRGIDPDAAVYVPPVVPPLFNRERDPRMTDDVRCAHGWRVLRVFCFFGCDQARVALRCAGGSSGSTVSIGSCSRSTGACAEVRVARSSCRRCSPQRVPMRSVRSVPVLPLVRREPRRPVSAVLTLDSM